jgi:hypothetical protein
MKLIKLLADIDQPIELKAGTILLSDNETEFLYFVSIVSYSIRIIFSVNILDAEELSVDEYLDVVEHINKL